MPNTRAPLVNNEYYHIINRSIAKFRVFSKNQICERFIKTIDYYQTFPRFLSLSKYLELKQVKSTSIATKQLVEIVAYCLMPTHFHIILKQCVDNGISSYMSKVENSFTKYFNIVNKRKGTLWEDNFKRILVESDEQLLHLTRYIHLNPVSAGLVAKPEDWLYSSYREYLSRNNQGVRICNFSHVIDIKPKEYKKFTEERIDEQKLLSKIKSQINKSYIG